MTATQINRVKSDNSISDGHPATNEIAGTTPRQDPRTNPVGQYTKHHQHNDETTGPLVESSGLLQECENCLEWLYLCLSNSDQWHQAGYPTVGLLSGHRETPARRAA